MGIIRFSASFTTVASEDPRNWRLEVESDRIDLYLELLERPRTLTEDEARMMVELVDAWRVAEHQKHIALMEERARRGEP